MTRIFHIFEGNPTFMGRRSSATRVAIDSGHSQLGTETARLSNRHDHRNSVPAMEHENKKTVQPQLQQHHKSISDIPDMAATPSRTFAGCRTSNGDTEPKPAYSEGARPAHSEGAENGLALFNYESLRTAAILAGESRRYSDLDLREYSNRTVTSPKRVSKARQVHSESTSSDIRDPFAERYKANANEARKREAESQNAAILPRSHAVYPRGLEPSELLHWKDGLRSSAGPPRRFATDAKGNKSPMRTSGTAKLTSYHNSPERKVERTSKDRRLSLSKDYDFASRSPKMHFREAFGTESPGASDFRESLKPFMTSAIVPFRENFGSRLIDSSGGGQNLDYRDTSVNVVARLMGLEGIPGSTKRASSYVVPDAKPEGAKFFRGLVQFDPQITRALSPPPPPPACQSKKHHHGRQEQDRLHEYGYQENYPARFNMEQGLCCCEEDRDYEHLRPFLSFEDEYEEATRQLGYGEDDSPPKLDHVFQAEDAMLDAPEDCPSLVKQSKHKKKMIWKILEAMRPKVLLKISRRKQTEHEVSPIIKTDVKTQQQITQVSFSPKLPSGVDKEESSRYTNFVKQEQQTESSNSTESSIVKPCSDETMVVAVKPADNTVLPNATSQVCNGDIFHVREVEAASNNSNEKEACPTGRATQINNEDWNLADDQKNSIEFTVAVEDAPRGTHTEDTLEFGCETDPSSTRQQEKSGNVRKSRKTRTTLRRPNLSSRSSIPEVQRKHGRASSPEARPSLSRSLPSKDNIRAVGTVGGKSLLANGKKADKPTPVRSKVQLAKEENLQRRSNKSPVRLRGTTSTSENDSTEKVIRKESFPIRATGAKARSPGAVRLELSSERAEYLEASLTPLKEVDRSSPATKDSISLDASGSSNPDVQFQTPLAQPQPSDSVMEDLVAVKRPKLGSFEVPSDCQISEVQTFENVSAGDPCDDLSQPSNSGDCGAVPEGPQPLLKMQEVKANEELTTPRGDQLNYERLYDKRAEAMGGPSPVSVLDTTTFEEDLSPSPTSSSKQNIIPMQDSASIFKDEEHESFAKDLQVYQDTGSAAIEGDQELDELQSYFKDGETEEETTFVERCSSEETATTTCEEALGDSWIFDKPKMKQQSTELINENLLQSLQTNGILQENDHVLLLDCLEEIMERILESKSDHMLWAGLPPDTVCEIPRGKQLEHELWNEMQNMKRSSSSYGICETVHDLLLKNLLRCHGRQWFTFNADRETLGLDIESMIAGDLVEETVGDLCALQCRKSKEPPLLDTTRRQLFTY